MRLRTGDMIRFLEVNQVAQIIDETIPQHYLSPKFDNAYCVKKCENGAIRWLKGKQSVLSMSPYVVNDAMWELEVN